jgi:zinc protease
VNLSNRIAVSFVAFALSCGGTQQQTQVAPHPPPPASAAPTASASPPPARPETPDAPFRAEAPAPGQTPAFTPPRIETFNLANGIKVMLVERHDLPIVVAQYITRRGGDDAPVAQAGLASLVGTLLETGTRTRNALQLSDEFAALGAEHATMMLWDSGGGFIKVLATHFEPALALLADVIQNPAFAPDEIERARALRLASLQQELDMPRMIAANVAARAVYGDTHPYGRALTGNEAAIRAITRPMIEAFYRSHFVPSDGAMVVVGDITRASLTPMLERTFGSWHARAPAPRHVAEPPHLAPGEARIVLVDRPRAAQSAVSVAHVGVPRSSPDYAAIVVMNTILGGMFSSRINLNLREAHSYTYGAGSIFAFRHGAGPFGAGGAIVTAATGPAIHEILGELARMRSENVTDAELALAKARITESLPARFETDDQTATAVSELFTFSLPMDEYATIAQRVHAVTAADVRRVAEHFLDPDHARIVVVGDRAVVEPQLRELNLGPIEIRDPHGERIPGTPGTAANPQGSDTGATHPTVPTNGHAQDHRAH